MTSAFCACRTPSTLGFVPHKVRKVPVKRRHRHRRKPAYLAQYGPDEPWERAKGHSWRGSADRRDYNPTGPRFCNRGRGGLTRLPAVLLAQYAFRHRNANWTSFDVPKWFHTMYGAQASLFRKPNRELKAHERELTLLVRLSWILYSTKTHPVQADARVSEVFYLKPQRPSMDGRRCALRTVGRHFLKQSDLVMAPLIMVTHYWPHDVRFASHKMARRPP